MVCHLLRFIIPRNLASTVLAKLRFQNTLEGWMIFAMFYFHVSGDVDHKGDFFYFSIIIFIFSKIFQESKEESTVMRVLN
jgi:hypothetical protein